MIDKIREKESKNSKICLSILLATVLSVQDKVANAFDLSEHITVRTTTTYSNHHKHHRHCGHDTGYSREELRLLKKERKILKKLSEIEREKRYNRNHSHSHDRYDYERHDHYDYNRSNRNKINRHNKSNISVSSGSVKIKKNFKRDTEHFNIIQSNGSEIIIYHDNEEIILDYFTEGDYIIFKNNGKFQKFKLSSSYQTIELSDKLFNNSSFKTIKNFKLILKKENNNRRHKKHRR